MKTVRWLMPVLFVLIVGVLVAPAPSEAAPTLQLTTQVNENGAPTNYFSIPLTPKPLPCTDAGFTTADGTCFSIPLGDWCNGGDGVGTQNCGDSANSTWTIGNYSANNTARVLVNDTNGNGLDLMKATGVTFRPVASGTRTLYVKLSNRFSNGNTSSGGTYKVGPMIGGNYTVGSDTADANYPNSINLSVTGNFYSETQTTVGSVGSTVPSTLKGVSPLGLGANGTASLTIPTKSYDNCDTGDGTCKPTVTQIYTFTVKDRDTVNNSSSLFLACGRCQPGGGGGGEFAATTTDPCVTLEAAINAAVKKAQRKDARALRRASGRHFPCLNCPGEERICNDKDDDPADDD